MFMLASERQIEDLQHEQDDEWLDEVLRETFPASDPVPAFHEDPKSGSHIGK